MLEKKSLSKIQVEKDIRNIIIDILAIENKSPESLPATETDFLTALGANSIDALEVIISVEEHFGIEFEDSKLRPDLVSTLDGFVNEVWSHVQAQKLPV